MMFELDERASEARFLDRHGVAFAIGIWFSGYSNLNRTESIEVGLVGTRRVSIVRI